MIVVEADRTIDRLDRLLAEVGVLLADHMVVKVESAPPSPNGSWTALVQEQLSDLRSYAMDLNELRPSVERFGDDPSLARRRAVLIKGIAQVSTFVDVRLVPHLRELQMALRQAGAEAPVTRLAEVLERLPETPSPSPPPPSRGFGAEQVAEAVRGIGLLRTSSVPGVSDVLADFEQDFRTTRNQIARMNTYKGLHDQLHHLQFDFFDFLEAHVGRMLSSVQATDEEFEDVGRYAERIRDQVVERSRSIAAQAALRPVEVTWIDDLQRNCETLAGGTARHDLRVIAREITAVDHLIGTRSEALNCWLIAVARLLPLDSLERALKNVVGLMRSAASDELPTLESSLNAIEEVHQGLDHLVDDHDTWQDIDRELREIAAALLYDPACLAERWPEQHGRVLLLSAESVEEWAQKLLDVDAPRLQQILNDQGADTARKARAFRDYRTHAGRGFYKLDQALLKACEVLGGLDEPLKDLLRRIQSSGKPQ